MTATELWVLAGALVVVWIIMLLTWRAFNLFNASLMGAPKGYTVSGYAWISEQAGGWFANLMRPLIDYLTRTPGHCRSAYLRDINHKAVP